MQPILLLGPAGSGKDTAARRLSDEFGLAVYRLTRPVLPTLAAFDWTYLIDRLVIQGADRAVLQRRAKQLVADAFRALDLYALVNELVVVPDVRLPSELSRLRAVWPQTLAIYCDVPPEIRAERLRARDGAVLSADAAQHHTERDVEALRDAADWLWDNSGLFRRPNPPALTRSGVLKNCLHKILDTPHENAE
jgi:dephospho-CoA kinase